MPAQALDERRVRERVGHEDPLDVELARDLPQVKVERLLGRERPDGPGPRQEYLEEDRRPELPGPRQEHHRAREAHVEGCDRRHQAEAVALLERVHEKRERVRDDAVLAQEIAPRAEALCTLVPDDDADGSEVERGELEAVALAERPYVLQPVGGRRGPWRIARIREHPRRPHAVERRTVQGHVIQALRAGRRVARVPVHHRGTGLGAALRVQSALLRRVRTCGFSARIAASFSPTSTMAASPSIRPASPPARRAASATGTRAR